MSENTENPDNALDELLQGAVEESERVAEERRRENERKQRWQELFNALDDVAKFRYYGEENGTGFAGKAKAWSPLWMRAAERVKSHANLSSLDSIPLPDSPNCQLARAILQNAMNGCSEEEIASQLLRAMVALDPKDKWRDKPGTLRAIFPVLIDQLRPDPDRDAEDPAELPSSGDQEFGGLAHLPILSLNAFHEQQRQKSVELIHRLRALAVALQEIADAAPRSIDAATPEGLEKWVLSTWIPSREAVRSSDLFVTLTRYLPSDPAERHVAELYLLAVDDPRAASADLVAKEIRAVVEDGGVRCISAYFESRAQWVASLIKNERRGVGAGSPPPRRRRGRIVESDQVEENRICDAWRSGMYRKYKDLADALGKTADEVRKAVDRHKKRLHRKAKRSQTPAC